MKYLIILTVGVCLLFAAVPVMAQSAADEAAVRAMTEKYYTAINTQDAKAAASIFTDDCESWDGTSKSKESWLNRAQEPWPDRVKNYRRKILDEIGVVFVTPDVAIHRFRMESSGLLDEDGKPVPPTKALKAYVFVKKDGEWLRAAGFTRPTEEE